MSITHQAETKSRFQSIIDFLDELSSQPEAEYLCSRCGRVMQMAEATFGVYGTIREWRVRLPICTCEGTNWKDLYRAAIFETDKLKMLERIATAESALVARTRELFHTRENHKEEMQSLDASLYALHALRSFTKFTDGTLLASAKAA